MKALRIFVAVLMLLGAANVAFAQGVTKDEVVEFVSSAVAYANEVGKEDALKEFSNRNGKFVKGELYIFAYDFNGTVIAHGGQPDLIGKNLIDMQDANGVKVIQELVKLAQNGEGWLQYLWPNPLADNKVEPKLGYVEKVDDTWFLGSGLYETSIKK